MTPTHKKDYMNHLGSPHRMYRISETQLSIARYYGGCKFNGDTYIYNPVDDSLIREDIFKAENKAKKKVKVKPVKTSVLWR